jgi:thiosulfate dehydrogenase
MSGGLVEMALLLTILRGRLIMRKLECCLYAVISMAVCIVILASDSAHTAELEKLSGMNFVQIVRGGLLYDNWPAELLVNIDKTHPSYPDSAQKKGPDTWRCKECHGWDYKGRDGDYSKGSHYTGIKGIREYADRDPLEVVKVLKDSTHAFGKMLSDNDYDALALFVSFGQLNMDLYINRETNKAIGDMASGGRIFLSTCIKCHGVDGRSINFKEEQGGKEYVGTVANNNPWETLHKVRWGHPDAPMVPLIFLELKEQLDVLSFCQALPRE